MDRKNPKYILWFKDIKLKDVALVGGKNASLGEMFSGLTKKGVNIPDGFALTSKTYWFYLKSNNIDKKIKEIIREFNPVNLNSLRETSRQIRNLILSAEFPKDLEKDILKNYKKLSQKYGQDNLVVAVRSSATAEDLPSASFAGQHETFLNISGPEELLRAVKKCFASLFLERAIAYREEKRFSHTKIALSVGIQKMIKSGSASSGVIFTLDTETGFKNIVLINSIFGVGEMIVKGKITPDQFYVFKPTLEKSFKPIIVKNLGRKTKKYIFAQKGGLKEVPVLPGKQLKFSLTDKEILKLADWAVIIEKYYNMPQDIEWAKDEESGELFVVQSRPETVHTQRKTASYQEYELKTAKKPLFTGIAIGDKIGFGKVKIIKNVSKSSDFKKGEILVAKITDPDWVPIMRLASAIITDEGGKTAHAAIVSRELGVPCIVGSKIATKILKTGQTITVDCTRGLEGRVFQGRIPFLVKRYDLREVPKLKTKIMVNIAVPETAFKASFLPVFGVGLAREEFIIAEKIRIHPLALYNFQKLKRKAKNKKNLKQIVKKIEDITVEYKDKKEFFVKELAEGIAQIASAFYPKEVIVRFSDFKTNEYRNLIGGDLFEKEEENPMLGFRGACRYLDKEFQPAFLMECRAINRCREIFGLKNISLMIPFCRTIDEGKKVLELTKKAGLERGKEGLKIYVMCEIPSNIVLAEEFLKIFDGMSIGSNDLTQLVLGLDRDSVRVAKIGDERNRAVKEMIKGAIKECKKRKKYVGICGEAPSVYGEFADFLTEEKIESISLSPDTVIKTILELAKKEKNKNKNKYV